MRTAASFCVLAVGDGGGAGVLLVVTIAVVSVRVW